MRTLLLVMGLGGASEKQRTLLTSRVQTFDPRSMGSSPGMACRIGYYAASVPVTIGCASLCHWEGGLYICLPSESNGPNLLDKPLKGFIVNHADIPW